MKMINVLFFLLVSFLVFQTSAGAPLEICSTSANYTTGSVYHSNLKHLVSSLILVASQKGYCITPVGENNDIVYGLAQCRPDQSTDDCGACLKDFSETIFQKCPKGKAALLREDRCILRYSNDQFFAEADYTSPTHIIYYNVKNASDIDLFNRQRNILMNSLKDYAVREDSKFKTGTIKYTNSQLLYGLVECTRDLGNKDCSLCLEKLIKEILDGQSGGFYVAPSCTIRYELYIFYNNDNILSPPPPSVRVPPPSIRAPPPSVRAPPPSVSAFTSPRGSNSNTTIVIVVATVIGFLLLIAALIFFIRRKRSKSESMLIGDVENNQYELSRDEMQKTELPTYVFEIILSATNNFSHENKLGEGGFGPVYKGNLANGKEIAVKRLSKTSIQGINEFQNEVILIAKLQHRNLVRLLGCCIERNEIMLIYEYMPNKSLDWFIFDKEQRALINWEKRSNIIIGIAQGLLYLHRDSRLRIIHRDLKAGNILLDSEMNPRISDFGMAKSCGGDQTEGSTNRVVGTYGYMSPEYAIDGLFSVKSDVFSFGVLLLEIVSGRRNRGFRYHDHDLNLLGHAWRLWNELKTSELVDSTMGTTLPISEVMRCIHVGLLCVQQRPEDRPNMSVVILMLSSESIALPRPKEPGFYHERSPVQVNSVDLSLSDEKRVRSNGLTVTSIKGR